MEAAIVEGFSNDVFAVAMTLLIYQMVTPRFDEAKSNSALLNELETLWPQSTPLRAIQAHSNGIQLLRSGFTVIRDVVNNALYADVALRQAIERWLPGPTVIPSGPMIGSTGGQLWPTPEMYKQHNIMFLEYIDANSREG